MIFQANNLTKFLPTEEDGRLRMLIGSEKCNTCHLFLHTFSFMDGHSTYFDHHEMQITAGPNWAIIKEATPTVDHKRKLVYFLSTKVMPTMMSLCVASYGAEAYQDCAVLTPEDLCYK